MLFVQFGNEYLGQQIALLHFLADVHVEVLDEAGYFREDRGLLEGIHKARLIDRVVDGPRSGWTMRTTGAPLAGTFCFGLLVPPLRQPVARAARTTSPKIPAVARRQDSSARASGSSLSPGKTPH